MPRIETMPNPHAPGETIAAWAWARITNLDHGERTILVEWEYFHSHAAAYTPGAVPIAVRRRQVFGPEPIAAAYGQRPQLTGYTPPVLDADGVEVAPAVDPTFGEAPLLSPRIPSYAEALAPLLSGATSLIDRIDQLGVAAYGGESIPAGPPSES